MKRARALGCVGLDGHEDLTKPLLIVSAANAPQDIGTVKGFKVSFSVQNQETVLVVALDNANKELLWVGGEQGTIRLHSGRDGINIDCITKN